VIDCVREAIESLDIPPGIQVQTRGLEDLPPVRAGQKRLTFVFTNLLENAIDALVTKGSIQVIGARQDGLVEVSIRDSGPGIAPEHHERIFEFDYSSRSVERPGKLGFGLWWVKTVMNRFGGKVTVISDGRQGTTFRLSFPLEAEER
jgi:signal transduction histidine kinase